MATSPNAVQTPSQVHPAVKADNAPRYTAEEILAKRAAAPAAERTYWTNQLLLLDTHAATAEILAAEVTLIGALREVFTAFSAEARALLYTQGQRQLTESGGPAVLMTREADGAQLVATLRWIKLSPIRPAPAAPAKESGK